MKHNINSEEIAEKFKCSLECAKHIFLKPRNVLIGSVYTYNDNDPRLLDLLAANPGSKILGMYKEPGYDVVRKETDEEIQKRVAKAIKRFENRKKREAKLKKKYGFKTGTEVQYNGSIKQATIGELAENLNQDQSAAKTDGN